MVCKPALALDRLEFPSRTQGGRLVDIPVGRVGGVALRAAKLGVRAPDARPVCASGRGNPRNPTRLYPGAQGTQSEPGGEGARRPVRLRGRPPLALCERAAAALAGELTCLAGRARCAPGPNIRASTPGMDASASRTARCRPSPGPDGFHRGRRGLRRRLEAPRHARYPSQGAPVDPVDDDPAARPAVTRRCRNRHGCPSDATPLPGCIDFGIRLVRLAFPST